MEQGKPLANSMGEVRGLIARCKDYAKTAELKDEIVSEDDDAQYLLRSSTHTATRARVCVPLSHLLSPQTGTGSCTHHVVSLAGSRRGIFRSVL